jgi:hypothetical protein
MFKEKIGNVWSLMLYDYHFYFIPTVSSDTLWTSIQKFPFIAGHGEVKNKMCCLSLVVNVSVSCELFGILNLCFHLWFPITEQRTQALLLNGFND